MPLFEAVKLTIDRRLELGDNLVVYDVVAVAIEALSAILPDLGVALVDDPDAIARFRDLEALKPASGVEPLIHGGREAGERVSQETAAKDRSGKECQRSGTCRGGCPRATAGQRAGRASC